MIAELLCDNICKDALIYWTSENDAIREFRRFNPFLRSARHGIFLSDDFFDKVRAGFLEDSSTIQTRARPVTGSTFRSSGRSMIWVSTARSSGKVIVLIGVDLAFLFSWAATKIFYSSSSGSTGSRPGRNCSAFRPNNCLLSQSICFCRDLTCASRSSFFCLSKSVSESIIVMHESIQSSPMKSQGKRIKNRAILRRIYRLLFVEQSLQAT